MAQRFGGKFSPTGQTGGDQSNTGKPADPLDARSLHKAATRGRALYIPAIILVIMSLNAGAVTLVTALVAGGILTLAAYLLHEGLRAEAAFNARRIARRPALPRKMLATALTGIGIGLAAWTGDSGVIGSVLYGLAAAGLHVAAFGIDPLADKRMEGIDDFQQDRVARVVDEAQSYLDTMTGQIGLIGDRRLEIRMAGFQTAARDMIRTVEEDPRDLTGARKFLGVYLMGARDATVKFVDLYNRNKDQQARSDFTALLDDLEQNFAARTEKMLVDDRSDMDIEIKVLRDRLQREGVNLPTKGTNDT